MASCLDWSPATQLPPALLKTPPPYRFVGYNFVANLSVVKSRGRARTFREGCVRLREHYLTHDDSLYECRAHEDDPFTDTCGPPRKGLGRS